MPEIGTFSLMSGDGKRAVAAWPKLPRPSSTLPARTSAGDFDIGTLWNAEPARLTHRLDVSRPDHLAPLLRFVGDQPAKVGGHHRQRHATKVGKPRLDLGIGKAGIDLFIELLDDLCRRILGCTEAVPITRLVARHELSHGRDVRQCVKARCSGDCERAQPASLDVL